MSTRPLIALAVLILAGCASMPERIEMLEQARAAVADINRDPLVGQAAPEQLRTAQSRLTAAEKAFDDRDAALAEHGAYLALRHAQTAQEQIAEARVREDIRKSEVARTETQLRARELEAQQARKQASQAQSEAEAARAEAARLEQELHAQQTERGLVLTLGDVLFDTAKATLKPGAADTLNRLAAFMREQPDRRVLVEGHTDSRGSVEYNAGLSERRAAAVRDALAQRGIDPARIAAVGAGENYPIASNNTAAGMQLNRRVEIVISDQQGNFPRAATRAGMAPAFPMRSACVEGQDGC